MLRQLLTFSLGAVALVAMADIEWVDKTYKFGTWSETEGLREGKTLMINNTSSPVLIRHVRPSCGCTGVDWPHDPIAPGDTAVISFNYNPEGRPGTFEKTIKVYLNDSTTPEIINIQGTVIGSDSSLTRRYPYKCGPLRFSGLSYDFGDITYGDMRHIFISIYNTSPEKVTPVLSRMTAADSALPVEFALTPETVEPGDIQTLSLFLNTRGAELGKSSAVQTICVGEDCIDITASANVVPKAATLSPEELAQAPQCDVRPDVMDIGKIKRGKKKAVEFDISNPGKSQLNISRVYSSRDNVKIIGWPMHLEPGKKGKVKVEINTAGYPSEIMSDVIEIITDDPLKPVRAVRVVGLIK